LVIAHESLTLVTSAHHRFWISRFGVENTILKVFDMLNAEETELGVISSEKPHCSFNLPLFYGNFPGNN